MTESSVIIPIAKMKLSKTKILIESKEIKESKESKENKEIKESKKVKKINLRVIKIF